MKAIGELVTGPVVHTLPVETTVLEASRLMTERRIGAVLVSDAAGDEGRLVGIFTERDLMSRVVVRGSDPASVRLKDVMTADLVIADPDQPLLDVAQEMQDRHIRHIPVVRDGEVVGILSLRDILRAHLEEKVKEVDALTAYIQGEGADTP